jgi:uncharacterized protein (TIRG00374 family)
MRIRYVLSLCVALGLTATLLYLFVQGAHWGNVRSIISSASGIYLAFALVPLAIGYAARMMRWHFMLQKHNPDLKISSCLTPYLSAFALNNLLPFRLGDIARIALFNDSLKISRGSITGTLLVERIMDFFTLLLFFCVGLYFSSQMLPIHHPIFKYIFFMALLIIIVLLLILCLPSKLILLIKKFETCLQRKNVPLITAFADFLLETLESVYNNSDRKSLFVLFGFSIGIWLSETAIFFLVAYSINLLLTTTSSIFVMSLATFSTLLPSTPGYVGTFHYFCRLALEWIGSGPDLAISFALAIHAMIVVPVTVGGMLAFVHHFGKHWKNKLWAAWGST